MTTVRSLIAGAVALLAASSHAAAGEYKPGVFVDGGADFAIEETYMGRRSMRSFMRVEAGNYRGHVNSAGFSQFKRYIQGRQRSGERYVCTRPAGSQVRAFQVLVGTNQATTFEDPRDCFKTERLGRTRHFPATLDFTPDGVTFSSIEPYGVGPRYRSILISKMNVGGQAHRPYQRAQGPFWDNLRLGLSVARRTGTPYVCILEKVIAENSGRIVRLGTVGEFRGAEFDYPHITNDPDECYTF